jgi:hypothetical protein
LFFNYSQKNSAGPLSPNTLAEIEKNGRANLKLKKNGAKSIAPGLGRLNKNNCLTIGFSIKNTSQSYTKWVLDSELLQSYNQSLLKNYRTLISSQYFTVVNNERIKFKGWGMISDFSKKYLQDVFYV